MTALVDIANLALQKIGAEDTIVSPEQDSHAARTAFAAWNLVRRGCIRGGDGFFPVWNFASRFAVLPARAVTPTDPLPTGWLAAFPLPAAPLECLRVTEVTAPQVAIDDYRVAAGQVLTRSIEPLALWYLADIVDPTAWDALFIETFAARLAYQIADRLTGDRGRKDDCWKEYLANLKSACAVDTREDPPTQLEESSWVEARYQGATGGSY